MSATAAVGTVKIKSTCTQLLRENSERISVLFSARLSEEGRRQGGYVVHDVHLSVPGDAEAKVSSDFISRLQVSEVMVTVWFGRYSWIGGCSDNRTIHTISITVDCAAFR